MSLTLLADIGGSKSRFALANSAGRPERILVIDNDAVAGIAGAVTRYLDETGARPEAATMAIAGPVDGEEVALTNRAGWRFRRAELARRFGFSQLSVLNDFEAIAWALPRLDGADTLPLGSFSRGRGSGEQRNGVKLVLGPGTGLGVAALVPAGHRWHVLASEGGHAAFGPAAADEVEPFARMRERCGAVSAECVLSGPGLVRLAHALQPSGGRSFGRSPRGQSRASPEAIVSAALAGEPAAAAAALLFVRLLGRFAGSLALTFKALSGVYIAGGVASGLETLLDRPAFREAFEAHPPHQALLATIPTVLVTCPEPGLLGCAVAAEHLAAGPA
ncbi:MAG TPA: glucokinase [Xanthobacteraceae bacterium]